MKHKHYDVLVAWLADQTLELERMVMNDWRKVIPMDCNPISEPGLEWRIKPKMVKVGRHEWPMPLDVAPAAGAVYWVVYPGVAVGSQWANDAKNRNRLSQSIVHMTQAAAQQHADALVCINRGDV